MVILGAICIATVTLRALQRHYAGFDRLLARASGMEQNLSLIAESRTNAVAWLMIGAIFLAGAFAWLEIRQPYYFAQDDALVAELPGMIEGCRSVWAGVWPDYDPCRLMGGPLAATGVFSLTYPPTYLSYAIARHLLRNENTLLEVFAALHLAAGYGVTTWLCRRLGMRPMIACCATLSFLLSGSILIMGRSWHAFLPIVVWLPLLMLAIERLVERPVGWKWALGTGVAAGILFHVGFPQIWAYAILFTGCSLVFLLVTGAISWRRLLWAWPAAAIALGVAAPLLVPQLLAARGVLRPPPNGIGITSQWIGALLPYPLVKVPHPMGWGSIDAQYIGHFVYFGTTFAVLFIASVLAVISRGSRRVWGKNVWVACALVAALLASGDRGLLFLVLSKVPLLRLVNNDPFRALPFFVLFAVIGAGLFAERALRSAPLNLRWPGHAAVLTLLLIAYHATMARASFYTYGFEPYPPMDSPVSKRIKGTDSARMISWTTKRSTSPSFASALPHNLPMLHNIPAFSGYDPLLEWGASFREVQRLLDQRPVEALRAYGVRWHLLSTLLRKPILSANVGVNAEERSIKDNAAMKAIVPLLQIVTHSEALRLGELNGTSPMAFPNRDPTVSLAVSAAGDGIRVGLGRWQTGGEIVVNFLWYPQMRAVVDGKAAPVSHDRWQRIVVDVPTGAKSLRIGYVAGWTGGLLIGSALVVLGLFGAARR